MNIRINIYTYLLERQWSSLHGSLFNVFFALFGKCEKFPEKPCRCQAALGIGSEIMMQ